MNVAVTKLTKEAAKTATGPMGIVAIEQYFSPDKRIIEDDLAIQILPFSHRVITKMCKSSRIRDRFVKSSDKKVPGLWGQWCAESAILTKRLLKS